MSESGIEAKIRLWASTLLWLRLRKRCWKRTSSGALCSAPFTRLEQHQWFEQIPEEHHKLIRKVARNERKRLKALEVLTGTKYGVLLVNERLQV